MSASARGLDPQALAPPGGSREPRVARKPWDTHVFTGTMKIAKVRRVGNSNLVSIPRELEAHGYAPGTSMLVEELDGDEHRSRRLQRCVIGAAEPGGMKLIQVGAVLPPLLWTNWIGA